MRLARAALGLSALGVLGVLLGRARAARQLRHDVERLFAQATDVSGSVYDEAQLAGLPAPVQRYFRHVLRPGQPYLRGLRLRHTGRFKTDLEQDWVAIAGEEYLVAEPPGFIWQGSTRRFTARDEYVAGRGRLTVRLLGAVPLLRGQGPPFDQGELLRWLGECCWLPTRLLPSERLRWTALDDEWAQLTLTDRDQTVSYRVRFNAQNELEECETMRYQSATALRRWVGRLGGYREVHGVRVPTELEGSWVLNGQRRPYARFRVQALDYEPLRPY